MVLNTGGHTSMIVALSFIDNGRTVLSVGADRTIRYWDVETGVCVNVLRLFASAPNRGQFTAAAVSTDGTTLAVAANDIRRPIYLIDVMQRQIIGILNGHTRDVFALSFSPDDKLLLSGGNDTFVNLWSTDTRSLLRQYKHHADPVRSVVFHPSQRLFASSTKKGQVAVCRLDSEQVVTSFSTPANEHCTEVRWTKNGNLLAGAHDAPPRLWDAFGNLITEFPVPDTIQGPAGAVIGANNAADFQLVFGSSGEKPVAGLLDLTTRQYVQTFSRHDNNISCGATSKYGTLAVTAGGEENEILIWNRDQGTVVQRLIGEGAHPWAVAWDRSSRVIAWGTNELGRLQNAFDLETLDYFVPNQDALPNSIGAGDWVETIMEETIPKVGPRKFLPLKQGTVLRVSRTKDDWLWIKKSNPWAQLNEDYNGPQDTSALPDNDSRGAWIPRSEAKISRFPDFVRGTVALGGLTIVRARLEKPPYVRVSVNRSESTITEFTAYEHGKPVPFERGILAPGGLALLQEFDNVWLFGSNSGKVIGKLRGAGGHVADMSVSPDGRFVLTSSHDQVLRVWNLRSQQLVLKLFFTRGDWVAWTPEGYYACSPGGSRYVGWHINNEINELASFYPAGHFRDTLYRPDLIRSLIRTGNIDFSLSEVSSEKVDMSQLIPPRVTITSPQRRSLTVDEPKIEIEVFAQTRVPGSRIKELQLIVNGRQEGEPREADSDSTKTSWEVDLNPGVTQIAVEASTSNAVSISDSIEVEYESLLPTPNRLPHLFVLAVGVGTYNDRAIPSLSRANKDANEIGAYIKTASKPLYGNVDVAIVQSETADRMTILSKLAELRAKVSQHDVALFFFSGHGFKDADGEFFFGTKDTNKSSLIATSLAGHEVTRLIRSMPGRKLILIDACHSAAAAKRITKGNDSLTDKYLRDLISEDHGMVLMAASMGREFAEERSDLKLSVFSSAILEGLQGKADRDQNGLVYTNELDFFVSERVRDLTGGLQHPVTSADADIRPFPLTKTSSGGQ